MNIPNLVLDVAIMTLPLGWFSQIDNSKSQKLALGFVYAVAGFVVAAGALRLQSLNEYAASKDFTWDFIPISILTALETNSALICVCLPTLNPLLQLCFHGSQTSLRKVRNRPTYSMRQDWPGQQGGLSAEEAGILARITGGEAPRKYYQIMSMDSQRGLEPPGRIKRGLDTPKESRFSDW